MHASFIHTGSTKSSFPYSGNTLEFCKTVKNLLNQLLDIFFDLKKIVVRGLKAFTFKILKLEVRFCSLSHKNCHQIKKHDEKYLYAAMIK